MLVVLTTTATVKLYADNDNFCLLLGIFGRLCFVDYNQTFHTQDFISKTVCEIR